MRILHSTPSLAPESGGTARLVTGLCSALANRNVEVALISLDLGSRFASPIMPSAPQVHTTFVRNRFAIGQRQLWSPQFGKTLHHLVKSKGIELIHDNCIWLPTHLDVTREARRTSLPIVVSIHGMLKPWALNHNRLRKQIMWHLYQERTLAQVDLLHATATNEANDLRQLNLKQPIAVIPNAVDVPPQVRDYAKAPERSTRTILFMGRIHAVKGLLNLIKALGQIPMDGWEVLIVGPDEGGHLQEVQMAVQANHLQQKVKFVGMVNDLDKWQYYQKSDLFVLPSFSENFSIVVAEALACGVPVITTTGTPWQELLTTKSGWWVEPKVDALAAALQEAMGLTDETRQQMGQNGRQLVQQNYSWEIVGEKMVAVYEWLLGQRDIPDCVYL
jgi:glycosyltransferase involved in cell wall biosynthesis